MAALQKGSRSLLCGADAVPRTNSLAQEKDQVAQQRAILYNAFSEGKFANAQQQALTIAVAGQSAAATAFDATATPVQQDSAPTVQLDSALDEVPVPEVR